MHYLLNVNGIMVKLRNRFCFCMLCCKLSSVWSSDAAQFNHEGCSPEWLITMYLNDALIVNLSSILVLFVYIGKSRAVLE